jgi:prevent-host-death family protein
MIQVNIHDAKSHFSKLLNRVMGGEEIIIAKSGKPVARLVSLHKKSKERPFGTAKNKIKIIGDFNEPLSDEIIDSFYK